MNKKKLVIFIGTFILSIILILSSLYIIFRQSVQYAIFELTLAQKYQDSQTALQYYDIEKIADSAIADATEELANDDNPFAGLGISMLNNMRDAIIAKYKKDLTEEYETEYQQLKSLNNIAILYHTITNKPIAASTITFKTISKNKVIQTFTNADGESMSRTWAKNDNQWKIIELKY
uniref:hypothetical protein n=1 Tax=Candidatus Stercorousia sp. TaxID=3048886 RepID=UPI004026DF1B